MNNSLYKITFYFFICIFISNCGFSLFNNSKKNKQPSDGPQKQEIINNSTAQEEIERGDILREKRLDNISLTSDDNAQEISILKAKIKYLEKELAAKGDSKDIFNNPYALFNQQIIMDNGTIYYGSVIYQDEQYVTIETLIGKLNLERNRIVRVLSHHLEEDDSLFASFFASIIVITKTTPTMKAFQKSLISSVPRMNVNRDLRREYPIRDERARRIVFKNLFISMHASAS